MLVELKYYNGEFYWENITVRKLKFIKDFKRKFPIAYWATTKSKSKSESNDKIEYTIDINNSSKQFELKEEIDKWDSDYLKVYLKIEPYPTEGDSIEYTTYVKSKYLNPIYQSDIEKNNMILPETINNKNFTCMDGFIQINRTKKAKIEFRFPREYNISINDFEFFCGSYRDDVDFLVKSEMDRYLVNKEELGGIKSLTLEVESPLLRHMYGIAWNPPEKATSSI